MKIYVLLFVVFLTSILASAQLEIAGMKVEYMDSPINIDSENPRFSWQIRSLENERGLYQKAYQIKIFDEYENEVWDSKKVESDVSLNIKYGGKELMPFTAYSWNVTVWDNNGSFATEFSSFETGLFEKHPESDGWSGAEWIGAGDKLSFFSHYFPVFKLKYDIKLDAKSKKASFVFGANDRRLLNENMNIYHLQSLKDESYIQIEFDISDLNSKNAKINIFRVGYHPKDNPNVPLISFDIPEKIVSKSNGQNFHTIELSVNLGHTNISVDGENIGYLRLNPLGVGGDFVAFPVVGDIGFYVKENQKAAFSNIEIRNFREPSNLLANIASFGGLFDDKNIVFKATNSSIEVGGKGDFFQVVNPSVNSVPYLRTEFKASNKQISRASLYASARGIYEIYINGNRVGNEWFNPGLTQYNKTHLYQTYDVTKFIDNGSNAIGAILGEGWWSGGSTFVGENWNYFGDRQSFKCKLLINYDDGSSDVIVTSPDGWKFFNDGAIVYSSFFQGEIYNALKEDAIINWNKPNFDDSKWCITEKSNLQNSVNRSVFTDVDENGNVSEPKLESQYGNGVKVVKELTAISFEEIRPGVFIYDMGQNMVGVPSLTFENLKEGDEIIMRYAEVKYPNLPEYSENEGMIMLENIRAAMAQDIYIAKGSAEENYTPRFTFHGYRFIEISGIDEPLPLSNVKGNVLSSVDKLSSYYVTSNEKVNKLWENITWSTMGNFLSIPTDCPQRNERLGWNGDISVFSKTATYLTGMPHFLRRHIRANRDLQSDNGKFPDVAPIGFGFGDILWGSAGITVPWESYLQFDDVEMIAEHYDAATRYIDYLATLISAETGRLKENDAGIWSHLGDWLSPEYNRSVKNILWEEYLIYDLQIVKKMAHILNRRDDEEKYTKLLNERLIFFNNNYIEKESGKFIYNDKIVDTQAVYALALSFEIPDEEIKPKVVKSFINTIERENVGDNGSVFPKYSLMTGFIGTAWINNALSKTGNSNVAYKLLQQTHYPSWLYPVEQGATTIWERLNSYTHVDGFGGNNRMNSFNHYSFGAVGAWMYSNSLGIARDENYPGFKHFIIKPEPDFEGEMNYAKGYYDSLYGRIVSEWSINNENVEYKFIIPANTTATLYLPVEDYKKIKLDNKNAYRNKDVEFLGVENKQAVFKIGSGEYNFIVQN